MKGMESSWEKAAKAKRAAEMAEKEAEKGPNLIWKWKEEVSNFTCEWTTTKAN